MLSTSTDNHKDHNKGQMSTYKGIVHFQKGRGATSVGERDTHTQV